MHLDSGANQVSESDETNNILVSQRVWEPVVLTPATVVSRAKPPAPLAGATDFGSGTILVSENKDGVRVDGTNLLWTACRKYDKLNPL